MRSIGYLSLYVASWFVAIGAFRPSLLLIIPLSLLMFFIMLMLLRSHSAGPKDVLDSNKQDGVIDKIPCECSKVYIGETGRSMHERLKEHDRDIRLARTQTSAVAEHDNKTGHFLIWNEVKLIDRDPYWYSRRVKKAIRLHPNNINRDSGIEISEAWMPTIKKHDGRSITNRTYEGTTSIRNNNEDQNAPIATNQRAT